MKACGRTWPLRPTWHLLPLATLRAASGISVVRLLLLGHAAAVPSLGLIGRCMGMRGCVVESATANGGPLMTWPPTPCHAGRSRRPLSLLRTHSAYRYRELWNIAMFVVFRNASLACCAPRPEHRFWKLAQSALGVRLQERKIIHAWHAIVSGVVILDVAPGHATAGHEETQSINAQCGTSIEASALHPPDS